MEFDKTKILTVVTADQAKVGQKGWIGCTITAVKKSIETDKPKELCIVDKDEKTMYPFCHADGWSSLFYPVQEPIYRPFNNEELNCLVGCVLTNKISGRRKMVTGKPTASDGVNLDGSFITAKDLLNSFTMNDSPCGREV